MSFTSSLALGAPSPCRCVVSITSGPLTHELIGYIFNAFDIKVERIVINALRSNTYFARIILKAQNEVHSKVIEIDARPSDCIVLATQAKASIFVSPGCVGRDRGSH